MAWLGKIFLGSFFTDAVWFPSFPPPYETSQIGIGNFGPTIKVLLDKITVSKQGINDILVCGCRDLVCGCQDHINELAAEYYSQDLLFDLKKNDRFEKLSLRLSRTWYKLSQLSFSVFTILLLLLLLLLFLFPAFFLAFIPFHLQSPWLIEKYDWCCEGQYSGLCGFTQWQKYILIADYTF